MINNQLRVGNKTPLQPLSVTTHWTDINYAYRNRPLVGEVAYRANMATHYTDEEGQHYHFLRDASGYCQLRIVNSSGQVVSEMYLSDEAVLPLIEELQEVGKQ